MTIEQTRQRVKDYHQTHNELCQNIKLARSSKDEVTLRRLNREFSKSVLVSSYIYNGWALDEAVDAISNKLNKDEIIKQLQENIDLIYSATKKELFVNQFLNYLFNGDEETIANMKTKLFISS